MVERLVVAVAVAAVAAVAAAVAAAAAVVAAAAAAEGGLEGGVQQEAAWPGQQGMVCPDWGANLSGPGHEGKWYWAGRSVGRVYALLHCPPLVMYPKIVWCG